MAPGLNYPMMNLGCKPVTTLTQAQSQLDAWLKASLDVAAGKSISISTAGGTRSITREDALEIRRHIQFWQNQVNALSNNTAKPYSLINFKD